MSARHHPCFDTWLSAPGSGACSWTIDNQRRPPDERGCNRAGGELTRLNPTETLRNSRLVHAQPPDP
jgi:hypothetical protein